MGNKNIKTLIGISSIGMGSETVNSVNSREVYKYLGLAKGQYSRWVKSTIDKYMFIENQDYRCLDMDVEGTIAKTYIVTIDMAKELCMISSTSKGREARKYFIDVEKKANVPMTIEQLLEQNIKVIGQLQSENLRLTYTNEMMQPKALFADSVAQSEMSILVGQFAKLISDNDFKIGQNRLFEWFRENGYLHSKGIQRNQPMQRYKEQGLFETVERTVNNPDGSVRLTITTKITGKGQVYFTDKLKTS